MGQGPAHRRRRHVRPHKRGVPTSVAWAAVAGATGLSVALGLYHLGTRSLWGDEGLTWITSNYKISAIWELQRSDGGHVFLYYLLIHYVTSWFGNSSFVLRLPSVIAGAVSVPLVFLLASRLLADRLAGVFAAVLFAVSMPLVYWQQNAREYAFIVLLAVASTLLIVRAVQEQSGWPLLGWIVLVAVACYTNPQAVFLPAAQLLPVLLWPTARVIWRPLTVAIAAAGAASAIPILAAEHHATGVLQLPPTGNGVRDVATFLASGSGSTTAATDVDYALLGLTAVCWAVAVVMLVLDLQRNGRTGRNFGQAVGISWLIVPPVAAWVISETVHPIFADRYLIVSLPAAAIVVAAALTRVRPRAAGYYGLLYLTVFRFGVLVPTYHVPTEDFSGATQAVAAAAEPGDCIAFYQDVGRELYDYYSVRVHTTPAHPLPIEILPSAPPGDNPAVVAYRSNFPFAASPKLFEVVGYYCPRLWLFEFDTGASRGPEVMQERHAALGLIRHDILSTYRLQKDYAFMGVDLQLFDNPKTAPHQVAKT